MSNTNSVETQNWSNPNSQYFFENGWPNDPGLFDKYQQGIQCGSCSFFASFNDHWGLCCFEKSRHFKETIFEQFTCPSQINEGWGPHSFSANSEDHCQCEAEEEDHSDIY